MTIQDVITHLETLAPLAYAENFDNVGLLVGDRARQITGVLVTLDTLETVVDEALEHNCNLIVSFHPIIFKGLTSLTGKTYVERVVMKAIKHDLAIYSMHTALDNARYGVNDMISSKLNLQNRRILMPQPGTIRKLTTYVPVAEADALREALFEAGAGHIGNYSDCSFSVMGTGSFKPSVTANPSKGQSGCMHFEKETQIAMIFPKHLESKIVQTLLAVHSYEEVAYEILTLENTNQTIGMGMLGELQKPVSETTFLKQLKDIMKTPVIKHAAFRNKPIKRVAVLGGSGSFAIAAAKRSGADILITSDLKYHDFFRAEGQIVLADIGHYESEQFTKNGLVAHLRKKITNFAVILSNTHTNPVKYF